MGEEHRHPAEGGSGSAGDAWLGSDCGNWTSKTHLTSSAVRPQPYSALTPHGWGRSAGDAQFATSALARQIDPSHAFSSSRRPIPDRCGRVAALSTTGTRRRFIRCCVAGTRLRQRRVDSLWRRLRAPGVLKERNAWLGSDCGNWTSKMRLTSSAVRPQQYRALSPHGWGRSGGNVESANSVLARQIDPSHARPKSSATKAGGRLHSARRGGGRTAAADASTPHHAWPGPGCGPDATQAHGTTPARRNPRRSGTSARRGAIGRARRVVNSAQRTTHAASTALRPSFGRATTSRQQHLKPLKNVSGERKMPSDRALAESI